MDGGALVVLRGYDKAHRLYRGRKSRTFANQTDQDIARTIARDHGLQADIAATPSVAHEYVIQNNQSDMEFLSERAERIGFELQIRDQTLVFKPPPSSPAESVDLDWGTNLLSFSAELTLSEQVGQVSVRSWDTIAKKEIVGTASRGETTTAVKERTSGGQLAKRAFNDSPELVITREHVGTVAEAEAIAQAALNELEQARITAEGEAIGDPRLTLGSEVNLRNVGARFSGKYSVASITHHYDQDGYRNHFTISGRRPTDVFGLLESGSRSSLQLLTGVVTNNSDARDRGRVKVKLPTLGNDVESHWCRIAAPGAGADRGLELLPEVDDEVLVAGSSINQLFVLGGLWNQDDRPPEVTSEAVSGGAVEHRIWKSRSGHMLVLDDSTGSPGITIVDSTGNNRIHVDTQSNKLEIAVDGDLSIEAGGAISIKAERDITIEAGTELSMTSRTGASLEAGTQLSLTGSASASIDGGARAELKAASVSIGP